MTLALPVGAVMNCADNSGAKNLYVSSVAAAFASRARQEGERSRTAGQRAATSALGSQLGDPSAQAVSGFHGQSYQTTTIRRPAH